MNNKLSKIESKDAFCDVRKAHRLIYQYQKRIIDLVCYIKDQFGMPGISGIKRFSKLIRPCQSVDRYANLKIYKEMWAWDFLYSYQFEFYLGKKILENNDEIGISLIEVSDSGFYESQEPNKTQTNIQSFKGAESSSSYLIIAFELTKQYKYLWDSLDKAIDVLLSGENKIYEDSNDAGSQFIVQKFYLEEFINQESTDKILREFNEYIQKKTSVNLIVR